MESLLIFQCLNALPPGIIVICPYPTKVRPIIYVLTEVIRSIHIGLEVSARKNTRNLPELFESSGFNRFNDEYRFSPPEEESTKIYEDVYYLITKSNANHTKSVLSHEHSLPQGMDKIIQGIESGT